MEIKNLKEFFSSLKEEDFFDKINLHIHSNFSDGKVDFDTLVEQAKEKGMKYISITDHNSVLGYKTSKYKNDEILIKGVEFDCFFRGSLLHILGYGIDVENEELNKLCGKNESERKNDLVRLFKMRHPKKVINAIHNAGGVAVLAHPCCCNVVNLSHYVKCLKNLGIDGIETYYPYNRFRAVVKFSSRKLPFELAEKYNLFKSGGSDEHNSLI